MTAINGDYPAHTLAPDPEQPELLLRPIARGTRHLPAVPFCPVCGGTHMTNGAFIACRDGDGFPVTIHAR